MSYKYEYTGDAEVSISGVGIVKSGDIVESETKINHPAFEKTDKKVTAKKEVKEEAKEEKPKVDK